MIPIRFIRDYGYGVCSDMKKKETGETYNCPDDARARDLIARGFAVEITFGLKFQPPDPRDYTINFSMLPGKVATLPASVDLRTTGFMPPVVDQGSHGTCTANAKAGINGYMEAKQGHPAPPAFSRNFIYYETVKNIAGENPLNDPGATIRNTFAEGQRSGACQEATWPYDNQHFGQPPNAAAIAEALQYQDLFYASLDPAGVTPAQILSNVKNMVAAGYPVEFGFQVYSNYTQVGANGMWPYPTAGTYYVGGHAVDVVGYNDATQCLLCRNSWGPTWGMSGYFWLPYGFITAPYAGKRLASDFWAVGKIEWMNV